MKEFRFDGTLMDLTRTVRKACGGPELTTADCLYLSSLEYAIEVYFNKGKQYADAWFKDDDPKAAAAFELKRKALRLYAALFTRQEAPLSADNLADSAADAVNGAAFIGALLISDFAKVRGQDVSGI